MSSYSWPPTGSGGVPIYDTLADFPPGTNKGDLAVAADTGNIYEWNGSAWVLEASPGGANPAPGVSGDLLFNSGGFVAADPSFTTNGSGHLSAVSLALSIPTGTPPLTIASTTLVPNLYVARSVLSDTVTTNANLTGPITSIGNATSIAAQTGTGTTFVVQTSPSLVTPDIGAATGASLSVSGQLTSTVSTGTPPLVVSSTTEVPNLYVARSALSDSTTLNANLTGVITSVGNATSTGSQTGTGNTFVMSVSPTLVSPALGTPTALVGTNITGTAAGLTAGTVTTNANLTGGVTSVGNAATVVTNANLTGPVTSTGNATAVTNNAITNAMLAQMPTLTLKGNNTGGTANALDLTVAQVNTMLNTLSNPMTTAGDMIYGGASGAPTRLVTGASGQVPISAGSTVAFGMLPGNSTALKAPTVQKFLSTGTQTGWLFTISTTSTVAVGDTYKENNGAGNTYTVLGALSAQSGQVLFMSGSSSSPTTPLVRQTGAGTSSISFTAQVAIATYTTPTSPAPLYIRVRMVGGGGGGSGSGGGGGSAGANGGNTTFGTSLLTANGGTSTTLNGGGGAGGSVTLNSPAIGTAVAGATGGPGQYVITTDNSGSGGGSSPFGGAGAGGFGNAVGGAAIVNSGSGGGGAGYNSGYAGGGGGAGGYIDALISSPSATYSYAIGSAGGAGTAGTSGSVGGAGGTGYIEVTEYYQ